MNDEAGTAGTVARSEVKGLWFMTARRYVRDEHGEEALARYLAAVPEGIRDDVADPVVSKWYPEEHMRDALAAFHATVADGDDEAFSRAMERCAVLGVNWFVQMLLSVTTPAYLLRLMPATLRHARRGPVRVSVETGERSAIVRITGQPYASDLRYRLATPAIFRGIVGICVGPGVRGQLTSWDATTQVCDLRW